MGVTCFGGFLQVIDDFNILVGWPELKAFPNKFGIYV
jgi:hypothetical protein